MSTAERPPPSGPPEHWFKQTVFYQCPHKLLAAFKGVLSRDNESMALIEKQPVSFPDGWEDESHYQIFDGLHYSDERGLWVARFRSPNPKENETLPYVEWTHAELEDCARISERLAMSTTQTDKALEAFRALIDREFSKLNFQSLA